MIMVESAGIEFVTLICLIMVYMRELNAFNIFLDMADCGAWLILALSMGTGRLSKCSESIGITACISKKITVLFEALENNIYLSYTINFPTGIESQWEVRLFWWVYLDFFRHSLKLINFQSYCG